MSDWRQRITVEPDKMGGKACIRGMRFSVVDVLDYLAGGMSPDDLLAEFPYLERGDIDAALGWAAEPERDLRSL